MDNSKVKTLRNKITIPLDMAIQLLQENNGDIDASEKAFHHNNIKAISELAVCDFETARESYTFCKYDLAKAIEKINPKPIILTTRENPTPRNEIGFLLYPINKNGEYYKTNKRNDAFIPTDDFDFIIKAFQSVFPMKNPLNNVMETDFDVCSSNIFDHTTCKIILEKMNQNKQEDIKVAKFIKEVMHWFSDKLEYADYIEVYGNL
jgi:hypothetical protein